MINLLDHFLEPLVSELRKADIMDCVVSLEEMNYEAALDELGLIVEISDTADTVTTLNRIDAVLTTAQSYFINSYGIVLDPGLPLEQTQSIVRCLMSLEFYILPEQLELLLLGDYDNEHILALLVETLEGLDSDITLPFIRHVNDSFIVNLKHLVEDQLMLREPTYEYTIPVSRIRLINRVMTEFGTESISLALELVRNGRKIGSPLRGLIDDSIELLDAMDVNDNLGLELLGLILISDVPTDNLNAVINEEIESFTESTLERRTLKTIMLSNPIISEIIKVTP